MRKRVSINYAEFDTLVRSCTDGETNEQLLNNLKKALRYVIVNELTPRQREMIMLYYFRNVNMPEIARQMGINKSTVSRTLSRARLNILTRLRWLTEYRKIQGEYDNTDL